MIRADQPLNIFQAAQAGDLNRIIQLHNQGVELNTQDTSGRTALYYAAANDQKDVVWYLCRNPETDLANCGGEALLVAVNQGHDQVVDILAACYHVNTEFKDPNGYGPLHHAAGKGKIEILNLLLDCGADKEATNPAGWTPLHYAAYTGQDKAVDALCLNCADKEARTRVGLTPLHLAASNNKPDVIKVLLKYGVDTAAPCGDSSVTALHLAAKAGHETVTGVLCEGKADINAVNKDGNSPLHTAAFYDKEKVVKVLLDHNADETIKNAQGQTPYMIAESKQHDVIRSLFEHKHRFPNSTGFLTAFDAAQAQQPELPPSIQPQAAGHGLKW